MLNNLSLVYRKKVYPPSIYSFHTPPIIGLFVNNQKCLFNISHSYSSMFNIRYRDGIQLDSYVRLQFRERFLKRMIKRYE